MYPTTITTITIILSNSSSFTCIEDTLYWGYEYDDGAIALIETSILHDLSVGRYPCITSTGL